MGRVSKEVLERLSYAMALLDGGDTKECSMCVTTLTHNVKLLEVQTGAAEKTVCDAIADKINETALPQDRVTGNRLYNQVRHQDGAKSIMRKSHNRTKQEIKDSQELKAASERNYLMFEHLITPLQGLTSCPISASELYLLFPEYMVKYFNTIDDAFNFLTELKEIHDGCKK